MFCLKKCKKILAINAGEVHDMYFELFNGLGNVTLQKKSKLVMIKA